MVERGASVELTFTVVVVVAGGPVLDVVSLIWIVYESVSLIHSLSNTQVKAERRNAVLK